MVAVVAVAGAVAAELLCMGSTSIGLPSRDPRSAAAFVAAVASAVARASSLDLASASACRPPRKSRTHSDREYKSVGWEARLVVGPIEAVNRKRQPHLGLLQLLHAHSVCLQTFFSAELVAVTGKLLVG